MSLIAATPWWMLLLSVIGVMAIGTLILNLFSSVGEGPDEVTLPVPCELGTPDFMLALAGIVNAPLRRGGSARLLNNGDEFFPAMLSAISEATETVNFTTYIWQDGAVSSRFFDALIDRARAGVQVRVLVDGFGGMKAPKDRIEELRAAGGRWKEFNEPRFGALTRLHKRSHRRALVVDGKVGFTGGAAVLDKWLGHAQDSEHWRDCMVRVEGRTAVSLQSAFTQLWAHSTGEILSGDGFYPDAAPDEGSADGERIREHLNFISSPSSQAHPMRHVFWLSIRAARKNVYITNPYFVPDAFLAGALMDQARAGVDVRVLVPNGNIDIQLIRWASQSYYEELLDAGLRIYEYQPTMIHQKLLVADGLWSLVGSVNMDVRSKELNQENAIGLLDEEFAATLEATFFDDLSRAEEIDLARWRKRPAYRHAIERFARLFEEQF